MVRTLVPQPIKYHGGKGYLAKQIVSLMETLPHLHYVETHFGGGAVLLERDPTRNWFQDGRSEHRGCSEVVNDIYGELTNFWRVLQDDSDFERFNRYVKFVPFSESAWTASQALLQQDDKPNWRRAAEFFVWCRQSMSGRMDSFAPLTRQRSRRGMNEQASAWLSAIDGLPQVHKRLQGVVILNRNAVDVLRQQDGDKTLFYLDPPYPPDVRTAPSIYEHEMGTGEHFALLWALSEMTGKFILSGYRCEPYDWFAETHGWNRIDIETDNKSGKGSTKNRRVECLWTNF